VNGANRGRTRAPPATTPTPWTWGTAALALVWSLCVFTAYIANGREIGSGDTVPAKYLTFALVRSDGFYLDRYRREAFKIWPNPGVPYYLQLVDGHYVSAYPVGPAILALPFSVPQILYLDWKQPGWDTADSPCFDTITKRSTAALTTLAGLALLAVLLRLGLQREAWLAATAAVLGSNLWCTASQSLWQHGPAALMLTLVVLLLLPESPSRLRFFLAGVAAALLVCARPIALAFAVMTALWVTFRHPRRLVWFVAPAVALGSALIGYNRAYLGLATGYYSQFEAALFATPWQDGLLGTLMSPSRGLFVFSPWTIVAVLYLPIAFFQLRLRTLLPWLLLTLVAHALLISTFSVWWAGWSFGPRYWTEVIPLLAISLGLALHCARRFRPVYAIALVLIAVSIGIQVLGALEYPSGWDEFPRSIDRSQERLWDWTDSELSRCVKKSKAYQTLFGPVELPGPASAAPPEPPASSSMLGGFLERVGCEHIDGWAWDAQRPNTPLAIELYDGDTLLMTVTADRLRSDLVEAKKGNGRHSFLVNTPLSLKDGRTHEIHAKMVEWGIELEKSPQALECPDAQSRTPPPAN
jgi:hypothetical protein